jgi:hypothetical protein
MGKEGYIAYFDCCKVAVETTKATGPCRECPDCGTPSSETVLTDEVVVYRGPE